jgi:hydroxyacylglutathione hydrolase
MRIVPVPCLSDNYAYLLVCDRTREVAVVDPSEAEPVLRALDALTFRASGAPSFSTILCTHHHYDHVGGNEELVATRSVSKVYAHASDGGRVPAQTEKLEDGDTFLIGTITVKILHIPGHTTGAIGYLVDDGSGPSAIFTGDTMFVAGCGRLFEGTPEMMFASLSKLAALPDETRVYAGHEYTEANLRFAKHLEPENPAIAAAEVRAKAARKDGAATMPSTIADEKALNPFLRVRSRELRASLGVAADATDVAVFAACRKAKDSF